MVKVKQLNSNIAALNKRLQEKEDKLERCLLILQRTEKIFREEISLYRLQKVKIETLEDAYHNDLAFMKDIENQLNIFSQENVKIRQIRRDTTAFKRIITRLYHQKEFDKALTQKRIDEIEQLISDKLQSMMSFQAELDNLIDDN